FFDPLGQNYCFSTFFNLKSVLVQDFWPTAGKVNPAFALTASVGSIRKKGKIHASSSQNTLQVLHARKRLHGRYRPYRRRSRRRHHHRAGV
ncbi:MAG: hypothetical protein KDA46_10495, partial [Parvularculaceae bacterium]|nr:hypothetical protein [Parvularculaceae bacterium]